MAEDKEIKRIREKDRAIADGISNTCYKLWNKHYLPGAVVQIIRIQSVLENDQAIRFTKYLKDIEDRKFLTLKIDQISLFLVEYTKYNQKYFCVVFGFQIKLLNFLEPALNFTVAFQDDPFLEMSSKYGKYNYFLQTIYAGFLEKNILFRHMKIF